jgi:molybdopterin-guanine dinucleotide biosynthesis protein A
VITASEQPGWTAIILAGQRPGIDPLAAAFGIEAKALVPIAGRPMLAHVAQTLLAVPEVRRIIILSQQGEGLLSGNLAWLAAEPRVSSSFSAQSISTSIAAVAGTADAPWPVLVTTADHPLLTGEMVRGFIAGAAGADVAVGVVGRRVLLAAYPDNIRTWLHFSDDSYSGANLFALMSDRARAALATWAEVEQDRKKALKLIYHFGPLLALKALTRTITLTAAMAKAGRKLDFVAKPVILPHPEAAIDVDKPADHALAEGILLGRLSPSG